MARAENFGAELQNLFLELEGVRVAAEGRVGVSQIVHGPNGIGMARPEYFGVQLQNLFFELQGVRVAAKR